MNQVSAFGLAAATFLLAGCASDPPPPEPKGSTESHLSGGAAGGAGDCVGSIDAQPGSADWQAQLQQCVSDAKGSAGQGDGLGNNGQGNGQGNGGGINLPDLPNLPSGGGGVPNIPDLPNLPSGGGGVPTIPDLPDLPNLPSGGDGQNGQSCSTSGISCVNGSCTCSSGPNQGQACDGSTDSGESSCSVMCNDTVCN